MPSEALKRPSGLGNLDDEVAVLSNALYDAVEAVAAPRHEVDHDATDLDPRHHLARSITSCKPSS